MLGYGSGSRVRLSPDPAAQHACAFQRGNGMGKDSRDVIRELQADGWHLVGTSGSHHHFKHPQKAGKVTVPHPRKDLHPKTIRSIYRQAGLQERR